MQIKPDIIDTPTMETGEQLLLSRYSEILMSLGNTVYKMPENSEREKGNPNMTTNVLFTNNRSCSLHGFSV